jgi:chemotaxis signal transduction protein
VSETAIASRALELRRAFDDSFAVPAGIKDRETVDLLEITLAGARYAIRTDEIGGIHLDLVVTPLPSPVPELTGIASLRGAMLPVYDLGLLLSVGASAGRWIVLDAARTVGLSFGEFRGHVRIEAGRFASHHAGQGTADATSQFVRADAGVHSVVSVPSLVEFIRQRASGATARRG